MKIVSFIEDPRDPHALGALGCTQQAATATGYAGGHTDFEYIPRAQ